MILGFTKAVCAPCMVQGALAELASTPFTCTENMLTLDRLGKVTIQSIF
jgi:hypothetical protein